MKTGVFGNLLSPKSIDRANWNSSKTEEKHSEIGIELPIIKSANKNAKIDIIINQEDIKLS